jgi:hypothetical protein
VKRNKNVETDPAWKIHPESISDNQGGDKLS